MLGLVGTAAGAGIGAGVDPVIKGPKLVVYRGTGPQASARLSLSPLVTARTKGVRLAFSFGAPERRDSVAVEVQMMKRHARGRDNERGGGVESPFGGRFAIAPDVDVDLAPDMLAVRPKVAMLVRF